VTGIADHQCNCLLLDALTVGCGFVKPVAYLRDLINEAHALNQRAREMLLSSKGLIATSREIIADLCRIRAGTFKRIG
jgi:hypothetical protein